MPDTAMPVSDEKPWVSWGDYAEHENFLIGNKSGFELLQRSLDRVLRDGECLIEDPGVEFVGVRILKEHTPAQEKARDRANTAALWGCGVIASVLIFVFMVGLKEIWNWMQ